MGKSQLNTLLVEIMITVLFFALASRTILRTFVVTRNQSREAGVYDTALMEAQNVADRLYVTDDFIVTLAQAGFEQDEQGWTLQEEDFTLRVMTGEEETASGTLLTAEITALHNEEELLTLPCVRYVPREVQP